MLNWETFRPICLLCCIHNVIQSTWTYLSVNLVTVKIIIIDIMLSLRNKRPCNFFVSVRCQVHLFYRRIHAREIMYYAAPNRWKWLFLNTDFICCRCWYTLLRDICPWGMLAPCCWPTSSSTLTVVFIFSVQLTFYELKAKPFLAATCCECATEYFLLQ
jgi:hypothetical protein